MAWPEWRACYAFSKMAGSISLNLVGGRVKTARLRSTPVLTQSQLAARLKKLAVPIDRAGISKLETGTRCVLDYEVVALATALGVSPGWLLSGKTPHRRRPWNAKGKP